VGPVGVLFFLPMHRIQHIFKKQKKSQAWLQCQGLFWGGNTINWLLSIDLHLYRFDYIDASQWGFLVGSKKTPLRGKHHVTFWDTFEIMFLTCCNPFWKQSQGHKTAIEGKIHWILFYYRGASCLEIHPLYRMGGSKTVLMMCFQKEHIVGSQTIY
jgi:hypothetical protein